MSDFKKEVEQRILANAHNESFKHATNQFLLESIDAQYSYNFSWLGRPIIQYPQDIVAMQELIWRIKPDLIVETGIAHGGSLILSASLLALLDVEEAIATGQSIDPQKSRRKVLGIDIDIRSHNREAIEAHSMSSRIQMIQGSSIAPEIVAQVRKIASNYKRVMICLDSNHTHDHVLAELQAYASLTSVDSYCVVFDTLVEDLPAGMIKNRPWGPDDNPKTAVWAFLKENPNFEIDHNLNNQLMVSVAPDGYLKRIS